MAVSLPTSDPSASMASIRYVYHAVPPDMVSLPLPCDTPSQGVSDSSSPFLIPLNRMKLRGVPESVYSGKILKYQGSRSAILQWRLPKLSEHREAMGFPPVLWNDCIHTTPVHPHVIYRALKDSHPYPAECDPNEYGHELATRFFRIPLAKIAHLPAVLYRHEIEVTRNVETGVLEFDYSDWELLFSAAGSDGLASALQKLATLSLDIPETTRRYYSAVFSNQPVPSHEGRPLLFYKLPHIMILGEINVQDCEIIDWSEPSQ